ncbi:PH domain-containing protein [Prevotella bivia]|uniref:PH domain-containing protein n=1 Tax=Prevotella bivia TaxID=28125 RepID=UPI001E43C486|nr:PH domain-containing protein [Prevotella bivia]
MFLTTVVAMPLLTSLEGLYPQMVVSLCSLLLAILLIARYITLTAVLWIINDNTLCRICGVFSRHTDYMELYRVVDYSESQTFWLKLWGVKTVSIISTDKTDRTMVMYGISARRDIVQEIRNRVENCKKQRRIYEITNQ